MDSVELFLKIYRFLSDKFNYLMILVLIFYRYLRHLIICIECHNFVNVDYVLILLHIE